MEHWKDIPGYEGRYQASTAGRVRSLDRLEWLPGKKRKDGTTGEPFQRKRRGVILKPSTHPSGHLMVNTEKQKGAKVHHLIMLTFTGTMPDGHEVLHKNHTPADNRPSNLKYGTRSENLKMDYANGSRQHLKVAA